MVPLAEAYRALSRLSPATTATGWQPMETVVKDSKSRLVWCPERKNIFIVAWNKYDECWEHFGGGGNLTEEPAAWMPLPPAPSHPRGEGV